MDKRTYWKSPCAYVEKTVVATGGQYNLKKKEPIQYTIEREFLSKISVKELLIRIIRTHLNQDIGKGNLPR